MAEEAPQLLFDVTGALDTKDLKLDNGAFLDAYPFEIKTNAPLFISLEANDFGGHLILLNELGKRIGNSSYFYGDNPGILLEKPNLGKYEIGITSLEANKLGKYKLKIETITQSELIRLQADFFFNQGSFLTGKQTHDSSLEAIKSFEQALFYYQKLNDTENIAISLNKLGKIFSGLGEKIKALEYFQQSLTLTVIAKNKTGEAINLYDIGTIYSDLGEKIKALEYFRQSLILYQLMKNRSGEGTVFNDIGSVYLDLGEKQKALGYFQQALPLHKEVENRNGEGATLNNIGRTYSDLGESTQALKHYESALSLAKELGNRRGEATTLTNIGSVYSDLGENIKALNYFQQALPLAKGLGNHRGEATTLNNIGLAYSNLGDQKKALEYYEQALPLHKVVSNRSGEANTLNNIGMVYLDLGEKKKALEYLQEALPLRKAVGDRGGEATTLNNIGLAYSNLEKKRKALEYYKQALLLHKVVSDRRAEATTLNNIGGVHSDLGDKKEALEYYEQALLLYKGVSDLSGKATTLNNIGFVYSELEKKQQALEYFQEALVLHRAVGHRSGEAITLSNIGFLKLEQDNYSQASNYFEKSIELDESINSKDLNDELKVSYFDTYKDNYLFLQNSLIAENKLFSALEVAERGRGRALVNLLNKQLTNKTDFISTEKPNIADLKAIAQNHKSTLITYSLIPTKSTSNKWEDTQLFIYLITPQGNVEFRKIDLSGNKINLSQLIQAARKMITTRPDKSRGVNSPNSYTIENFAPGDYVKLQGEFPSDEPWRVVALNRANQTLTLDQKLRENPLENVSLNRIANKTNTPLQQLHDILIEPIADLLPTDPDSNVIFMPQGALFGVPFPALQNSKGQYLIESHTILTSPSIQVLSQTAKQNKRLANQPKNPNKALIIGNPYPYPKNLASLDNASNEAQAISNLLGVQPLLGKQATEAIVMAKLPQADILHFATHASFDDENGLRSAIYLTLEPNAPDDDLFQTPGRITAEELFNQFEKNPLNAKIAVLSACDTGQGEITGDGVIGLSRSLIAAGVPSVIVSLWSVDDASTAKLMTEFYQQWQKQGMDKATALRNAMLKTKTDYPDPYYWSAFTLIGEAE